MPQTKPPNDYTSFGGFVGYLKTFRRLDARAIAKACGVREVYVEQVAREHGITLASAFVSPPHPKRPTHTSKPWSDADDKALARAYEQGLTNHGIGARIGRTTSGVSNRLSELRKAGKIVTYRGQRAKSPWW